MRLRVAAVLALSSAPLLVFGHGYTIIYIGFPLLAAAFVLGWPLGAFPMVITWLIDRGVGSPFMPYKQRRSARLRGANGLFYLRDGEIGRDNRP